MIRNVYTRLAIILIIMALALWIDLNDNLTITNPFTDKPILDKNVATRLGLDLQGGLQVLLEADIPPNSMSESELADSMQTARTIMENRTNALGVSENVLQIAGNNRIQNYTFVTVNLKLTLSGSFRTFLKYTCYNHPIGPSLVSQGNSLHLKQSFAFLIRELLSCCTVNAGSYCNTCRAFI